MKKILLVSAIAAVLAAPTVSAQSAFEGAYGQIGVGYESIAPSFSGGTVTSGTTKIPYSVSSDNSNGFTGNVALGYTFALSKEFTLGIGAEYAPIESTSGNFTLSVPSVNYTEKGTYKKTNSYNIFLAPGYVIAKDKLAYVKVGYTGASIKDNGGDTTNYTGYSAG